MEVLEHVPDPAAVLGEMARVASRWLLVSVPREPLWRGPEPRARRVPARARQHPRPPEPLVEAGSRGCCAATGRSSSCARRFRGRWRSSASGREPAGDRRERGSYGRGAALLSALIGVTGLLTYAFHSIAAHALGRDDYG